MSMLPGLSMWFFGKHFVPGFKTNFAAGFVYATLIDVMVQELGCRCERMLDLESYREKLAEEYGIKQRDMVDGKK